MLSKHWLAPVHVALAEIESVDFTGSVLRPTDFGGVPEMVALKAFELLAAQARNARAIGVTPGGKAGSTATAARAIQILKDASGSLADVMLAICDECVVQRHIQNTMRKMGNQQDCSLRFYPDGPVLVPTEIDFSPGYSGSRLQNTMRILFDVGLLNLGSSGASVAGIGG